MKKRTIYSWMLCLSLLAGGATLTSCRDEFTEEEVLKEQQTIDLAITAFDLSETKGLAGATVSFSQNGQKMEKVTDESGVANFADVKIGSSLIVTITKEGFATTRKEIDMSVGTYRESQISNTFNMYALDGLSTAIIRGKAEIETDVTNDKAELVPAGTTVEAYYKVPGEKTEISVKGQVDANGMYSLKVPATKDGIPYSLRFPTLELDQTIAKNGNIGDKGFPIVEPSIDKIKTLFDPTVSFNSFSGMSDAPSVNVPSGVLPVYAIIEAPNDATVGVFKEQAIAGRVSVNSAGEITSIALVNNGEGYKGNVKIEVKSLFGGSGVEVVLTADAFGDLNSPVINQGKGGSGYPTFNFANQIEEKAPQVASNIGAKSGDIKVVNVNYGTGTSRAKDIK
jgi:hypothetical protein